MAITTLDQLRTKGALAAFQEELESIPQLWEQYVQNIASVTNKETHVFAGNVPKPREMLSGRTVASLQDFNFDITNRTYELTMSIKREWFEDDQTGQINQRFRQIGEAFGHYKNELFANLLINGDSATLGIPPLNASGGAVFATFYGDSGSIGSSGTIDNNISFAAATGTVPTYEEFLNLVSDAKAQMMAFADSTGRKGHALGSLTKLGVIVPPQLEGVARTAMGAALVANTSNVRQGMADVTVMPYLTSAVEVYTCAVGGSTKPFINQERSGLEVIVDMDEARVAERDAVLVMGRERFSLEYGAPWLSVLTTIG